MRIVKLGLMSGYPVSKGIYVVTDRMGGGEGGGALTE